MQYISRQEFDLACVALSEVVTRCATDALRQHGFRWYKATPLPPSSFDALKTRYRLCKVQGDPFFPVLRDYCDDVIYCAPWINRLYRAWHDLTHIELDRGFDFRSELAVARFKSQYIPHGLLREIMLADAVGESEFAHLSGGKFPLHQREWAYDYVTRGLEYAYRKHIKHTA